MQKGIAAQSVNPRSTVSLRDHPIHAMLVPVPVVCFAATLHKGSP